MELQASSSVHSFVPQASRGELLSRDQSGAGFPHLFQSLGITIYIKKSRQTHNQSACYSQNRFQKPQLGYSILIKSVEENRAESAHSTQITHNLTWETKPKEEEELVEGKTRQ